MISRPGNGQPSMSKLVKHLKILSFRCGNYNFAFICTEQCYEFVSYKFEQPFPSDFLVQIYSVFDFSSYETTSVSTSKTLKKNVALDQRTKEEIFEKSSRTRLLECPIREVESARSGQTDR